MMMMMMISALQRQGVVVIDGTRRSAWNLGLLGILRRRRRPDKEQQQQKQQQPKQQLVGSCHSQATSSQGRRQTILVRGPSQPLLEVECRCWR